MTNGSVGNKELISRYLVVSEQVIQELLAEVSESAEGPVATGKRRLSNSTAEFNNTVTLWIEQFRRRQHSEAQRTFRSLFRES